MKLRCAICETEAQKTLYSTLYLDTQGETQVGIGTVGFCCRGVPFSMDNIFPRVTQREHVLEANTLRWDTELKWCLYSSGHSFHETASEILVMGISSPRLLRK